MNQADLLTALRQFASGKAGGKPGAQGQTLTKQGKEKAEHFREQLRQVAKEPKAEATPVPKVEAKAAEKPAVPPLDAAAILAELSEHAEPAPDAQEERKADDVKQEPSAGDAKSQVAEWRGSDTGLGTVIASLDRAQAKPVDKAEMKVATVIDVPEKQATDGALPDIDLPGNGAAMTAEPDMPEPQRFSVAVETSDTKQAAVLKVAVRDQETHFEPVQQPTMLQKIVDRMATDLSAATKPDSAPVVDSSPGELGKQSDSRPVRMMTLQLDPPNLGMVTVKMRMAGDAVEIHLAADSYETTQILRQERGSLSDAMQSAGYTFDIAAIDHSRASSDAGANNTGQQQQQASSEQRQSGSQGGPQSDSGTAGRSPGDSQNGARQNRQQHEDGPQLHAQARRPEQDGSGVRSGTVYL